jgi:hypothetical protein
MTTYSISEPNRPWVVLFTSPDLGAVAEAVAAQAEVDPSCIYATLDGKSRPLSKDERIELFLRVLDVRPHDPVATAELDAAQLPARNDPDP